MPLRFSLQRFLKSLSASVRTTIASFRKGPTIQDLTKQTVFHVAKNRALPSWEQCKLITHLLTKGERWTARIAMSIAGLSVVVLMAGYLFLHQTVVPSVGGTYTEGLIGTPQFVNPLYAVASDVDTDLTHLVFSGLMKYEPGVGLVPDLAESFDLSDDGKIYTFVLRQDARWHDGNPVRVSDVVATFSMMQSPEYKSPLSVIFKGVTIEEVDERTVQFILNEPFAPFLSTLTVGILPSHIWDTIPARSAPLAEANLKPIGSGPYRFATFTKDKLGSIRSYTLQRNPDFYLSAPSIERLTFKFYPDAVSALDALNNKNIDGVSYLSSEGADEITRTRDIEIVHPLLHQYTALFFNEVHASALKDVNVRRALTNAVPKEQIVQEALHGFGQIVHGPILKGMEGYDETIRQSNFDLGSAKTLLDASGWTLSEGATVRTKKASDGTNQSLTLTITTVDFPEFMAVAELVKQQWQALGIDVSVEVVDADSMQQVILKERSYDVLLSGVLLGVDPDPYPFWHSSQIDYPGLNIALYADKEVDKLLEKGRTAVDQALREQAYVDMQVKLVEDAAAVFLYQRTYTFARLKDIKGANTTEIVVPADRFADVTNWYMKTKRVVE